MRTEEEEEAPQLPSRARSYPAVPRLAKSAALSAAQLTAYNMDKVAFVFCMLWTRYSMHQQHPSQFFYLLGLVGPFFYVVIFLVFSATFL